MNTIVGYGKSFMAFLKKDSWPSFAVTLALAFILIKYVFFPGLSLLTGTSLPLVIVESCSMYHHEEGFEKIFSTSKVYESNNVQLEDTENWIFQNGFTKGDIIFVVGPEDAEVGDVIIFEAGSTHPLIHRVVKESEEFYATKGDNYVTNANQLAVEQQIYEEQVIGKALFRVPLFGWVKLFFFEFSRPQNERGFCS